MQPKSRTIIDSDEEGNIQISIGGNREDALIATVIAAQRMAKDQGADYLSIVMLAVQAAQESGDEPRGTLQ